MVLLAINKILDRLSTSDGLSREKEWYESYLCCGFQNYHKQEAILTKQTILELTLPSSERFFSV